MDKLLTISIAAYNVEKYIKQCLDSLIITNMDRIEVLIQNDGSKDATLEIAKEYENRYPGTFVLVNKQNGGYGSTINNSLRMAKGKYFKQLDGDDWFETPALEELVSQLEQIDADCIYTPYLEVYEDTNVTREQRMDAFGNRIYLLEEIVKKKKFLGMHALAFKTSLLRDNNVRILENCFYTAVEYVVYPLIATKDVYVWNKVLYCYRLGREGQSVSLAGFIKHSDEHELVIKQLLTKYDQIQNCLPNVREALIGRIVEMIAVQTNLYLTMGNKQRKSRLFDHEIKECYPAFYKQSGKLVGKKIKLLRMTNYLLYPLFANRGR